MNKTEREEVIRLSEALFDGRIKRMELARLEELIEGLSGALDVYLEVSNDISVLQEVLGKNVARPNQAPKPSRWDRFGRWSVAAAAVVALGLTLWAVFLKNDPSLVVTVREYAVPATDVAVVSGEVGVRWAKGIEPFSPGDPLVGETVVIDRGALEVTCENGVVLLIEGPASFHLKDAMNLRLDYGNLVGDVPLQGQGFTVEYGEHRLIDHGTKFGMRVFPSGDHQSTEIAVFQGEVEVQPANTTVPVMLGRYDAVVLDQKSDTGVYSIPLDEKKFLRELPHTEIPWAMPPVPTGQSEVLEFDVSALVRGPGKFFAVFKWMRGKDALTTSDVMLLRDDELVWLDRHIARTGVLPKTTDNIYWLDVPEEFYRDARWTLRVTALCQPPAFDLVFQETRDGSEVESDSKGVLYFDDSTYLSPSNEEFLGKWRYIYDGMEYERELLPGGRAFIKAVGGRVQPEAKWWMEGDVMHMYFPENQATERHLLRGGTLLFIDRPYRNARKHEE